MKKSFSHGILIGLATALTLGVVFCVGIYVGPLMGVGSHSSDSPHSLAPQSLENASLPDLLLQAEAGSSGKQIGLATGSVIGDADALFALDYTSGDLYCWILNPKVGTGFQAEYKTNVEEALGVKKGEPADYVLITGQIDNSGVQVKGNSRPASSVCYVADGNTGRVAGFSFFYSRTAANYGGTQAGELTMVCDGRTRGNIQRE